MFETFVREAEIERDVFMAYVWNEMDDLGDDDKLGSRSQTIYGAGFTSGTVD